MVTSSNFWSFPLTNSYCSFTRVKDFTHLEKICHRKTNQQRKTTEQHFKGREGPNRTLLCLLLHKTLENRCMWLSLVGHQYWGKTGEGKRKVSKKVVTLPQKGWIKSKKLYFELLPLNWWTWASTFLKSIVFLSLKWSNRNLNTEKKIGDRKEILESHNSSESSPSNLSESSKNKPRTSATNSGLLSSWSCCSCVNWSSRIPWVNRRKIGVCGDKKLFSRK